MSRNIYQNTSLFHVGIVQSRAARNILEMREKVLKGYDLASPEWFVLGYVQSQTAKGGIRVGDIAAMLDVQSTYITGILRKLEAKELVRWATDEADRRARIVTVTKKGKAVADAAEEELTKQDKALLGSTPDAAVKGYLQVLSVQARMD